MTSKTLESILYKRTLKSMYLMLLFSLTILLDYNITNSFFIFSSANNNDQENKANTWISKRDNLNITMSLEPKVPVIDEKTKIIFDIRKLNSSGFFDNTNARVTITDHDGRLFKFDNQPILNAKFSVDYIFPDDGAHSIIFQLYKNNTAFTVGSFDIIIPHQQKQQPAQSIGHFFSNLFKNAINFKF